MYHPNFRETWLIQRWIHLFIAEVQATERGLGVLMQDVRDFFSYYLLEVSLISWDRSLSANDSSIKKNKEIV